jgi:prophage maintenance system killer protein
MAQSAKTGYRALTGLRLVATGVDTARIMLAPAAGDLSETELAEWLRSRIQRR